jgi:hypothetical protein
MINTTFLLAGRATFVVENNKGISVTVQVKKTTEKINPYNGRWFPVGYFVSTRFQNEAWQYQGILDTALVPARIRPTRNTQFSQSKNLGLSKRIAEWAITQIRVGQPLPAGYRLEHTNRCGKCAKMLRDDVSIQRGIGPDCARQMGLI